MVDQLIEIPLPGRTFRSAPDTPGGNAKGATLPSFVAGPENQLVAAAIGRLLDAAGQESLRGARHEFNAATARVLALYGPSGTGKTHLLRGAVRWWQDRAGPESAEYITASDFRRRLTDAIDADQVTEFRDQVRGRSLLAVDDLQRFPSTDYLQQELSYTIDQYEASGAWLVVASGRPVNTLANLSPGVRSRLSSALLLPLAPPGTVARGRIAQRALAALGRTIPNNVAERFGAAVSGTASDLFGSLLELHAAVPHRQPLDAQSVGRYLAQHEPRRPPLREIIAVVAKYHAVPQKVLKSGVRKQAAVVARSLVTYLARELTGASYERIGHALGGRDHTTVMHSYRKIHRQLQHDVATQETVSNLCRLLLTGS